MAGGQLIFQPPKFDWHTEDQQQAFIRVEGSDHISVTRIQHQQRYLVCHNYQLSWQRRIQAWWNTLPISTDEEAQKDPEKVFKAIADTLKISTSYWNHIDEIYSDIKQGNNESTDQLDQRIKNLVERCQYSADEKLVRRTELLFHATKYFKVKKCVQSKKR